MKFEITNKLIEYEDKKELNGKLNFNKELVEIWKY